MTMTHRSALFGLVLLMSRLAGSANNVPFVPFALSRAGGVVNVSSSFAVDGARFAPITNVTCCELLMSSPDGKVALAFAQTAAGSGDYATWSWSRQVLRWRAYANGSVGVGLPAAGA
jgi:hypothetical protein